MPPRVHARGRGAGRGEARVHVEARIHVPGGGDEELRARGEVQVDGLTGQPGRLGDVAHAHPAAAGFLEDGDGRIEDAGACVGFGA